MAKRWKTCFDLRANLISTKVSASHRKSTQVHASPGQTKSQVDPSLQLASTCVAVWPGPWTTSSPCFAQSVVVRDPKENYEKENREAIVFWRLIYGDARRTKRERLPKLKSTKHTWLTSPFHSEIVDCDFLLEACTKELSLSEGKKSKKSKLELCLALHFSIKGIIDPNSTNINNDKYETGPSSLRNFGIAYVISHS